MTDSEFAKLCRETRPGTALTFATGAGDVRGSFIGCTDDSVIIEVNGKHVLWPYDLISCRKSGYPTPSYS